MPWARFDDRYPLNRKVHGLSDAAFRLDVTAICWSAGQLTDGRIDSLGALGVHRNGTRIAQMLVRAGRWHESGHECPSEYCYPIESGWLIHDWQEYNKPRDQVRRERKARQERQERWRQKHRGDASPNASPNASRNASRDATPARPAPKEAGRSPEGSAAASPYGAAAGANGRADGLTALRELDDLQAAYEREQKQKLHQEMPDIFPSPEDA